MGDGNSHVYVVPGTFQSGKYPHIPGLLLFVSYDGPGEGEGSAYPLCANEENRDQEAWVTFVLRPWCV